jgi:hypothetical protein
VQHDIFRHSDYVTSQATIDISLLRSKTERCGGLLLERLSGAAASLGRALVEANETIARLQAERRAVGAGQGAGAGAVGAGSAAREQLVATVLMRKMVAADRQDTRAVGREISAVLEEMAGEVSVASHHSKRAPGCCCPLHLCRDVYMEPVYVSRVICAMVPARSGGGSSVCLYRVAERG